MRLYLIVKSIRRQIGLQYVINLTKAELNVLGWADSEQDLGRDFLLLAF